MARNLERVAAAQERSVKQSELGEYEAPCAQGEYNNNSDLCAQWYAALAARDAANWSYWTFWLALGSLALSAIGIVFIKLTLDATREAVEEAGRNTAATIQAERPHLRFNLTLKEIDPLGQEMVKDGIPLVRGINFHNSGRTPAMIETLWIDFKLSCTPPRPCDCRKMRRFAKDAVAAAGADWPQYNNAIKGWKGGVDFAPLIAAHDEQGTRLFVYGLLVYRDAFGKKRRTGFCRVFDGANFVYNQGDVDELNYAT